MSNQTNTRRKHLDELALKAKIQPIADKNATASEGDELTPVCPHCGCTEIYGSYSGQCDVTFTLDCEDEGIVSWEIHNENCETLDALYCPGCSMEYKGEYVYYDFLPGIPGDESTG